MIDPEEYLGITLRDDNLQRYVKLMKRWLPEIEIHRRDDGGVIIPSPKTLSSIYRSGAGEIGYDKKGSDDYDTGVVSLVGARLEVTSGVSFLTIRKDYNDKKSKSLSRMTGVSQDKTNYWAIMDSNAFSPEAEISTEGLLADELSSTISSKELKLITMLMPDFLLHFEEFMEVYRKSLAKAVTKGILNQNVADGVSFIQRTIFQWGENE